MAPMGSGKGTIIRQTLDNHPDVYTTVSCTSRSKRPGEEDGEQYYFLTKDEFKAKIDRGEFLEWAEFAGNLYGTLKDEIIPRVTNSEVVLVEIEVQGVEQLLQLIPLEHLTITYIEAGGWEILRKRAEARAPISEEELDARYQRFLIEEQAKPMADVIIDNSESVEVACRALDQVIAEAKKKCKL
jgi:guanylate kinase